MKNLLFFRNKTGLWVLFVLLAGAGIGWIVFENTPRNGSETTGTSPQLSAADPALTAAHGLTDSDDDGLLDWEEELWNTDPDNPDTDSDGTRDGDEVAADRNPTKPGPNDALQKKSSVTLEESIDAYLADESRTETDKVALKLFQGYSELRKTNALGGPEETAFVNKLVTEQLASEARQYREHELSIVPANDETRKTYKQEYDAIVAHFSTIPENELVTLQRAMLSEDESEIVKLDTAVAVYTDAVRQLLTLSVPEDVVPLHLAVLNNLSMLRINITDMRVAFEDPIRASAGMQAFFKTTDQLSDAFQQLYEYFEQHQLNENES